MNEWEIAALVLFAVLGLCMVLTALLPAGGGLVALELSGTVGTAVLLLLAEGLHRSSFASLAIVFAFVSFVGSLAFARLLERRL
jgi:multisubunit Na+/H+ antiporter MnhF subunit